MVRRQITNVKLLLGMLFKSNANNQSDEKGF